MTAKTLTTADLYAMLDARRIELGLSQLQLGQLAFGRPDSSAMQNLRRGSSPTFDRLSSICDALGFELYCGPRRSDDATPQSLAETAPASDLAQVSALRAGYLPLPWHSLSRQAGASPIALHAEFFDRIGLPPDGLSVVAPERCHIPVDNDLSALVAVVAADARRSSSPQVWAFLERGRATVARIQSKQEALLIHDADPDIGVRLLDGKEREAVTMLGRVVWMGLPMAAAQGQNA